jgi:CHAT domain-containing protein/Tfp pilus assembly protein PilF
MNHPKLRKRRLVCVSALALTTALIGCGSAVLAQSTDETAVRALLDRFFVAYQKEDLTGIESLLSARSTDLAATKQRIQKVFTETEQLEIKGLTIRRLTVDGTKAVARVNLELSAVDRKTKAAAAGFGKMALTLRAVKEDDVWKVWQFIPSAEDLAIALVAAQTDEERKSLLAAEPELVTIEMQRAVIKQGNRYLSQESFSQAIAVYNFAISIAEKLGDKVGVAQPLNNIGMAHKAQGNYPQALEYFQRSLKLGTELGDKLLVGTVLNNVGLIHSSQGTYAQALEAFQKSLALSQEVGNKSVIARTINNLGMVHYLQRNYDQALQYFEQSMALKQQLNDKPGMVTGLNNIGLIYADQGDFTHALDYYQRSQKLAEELGNKEVLASIVLNIGDVYNYQASYDLALKTYQQSLAIAEEIGTKDLLSQALSRIGDTYYLQGNFEKSLQYSERAGEVGRQIGSPERLWYARALAGKAHAAGNRFDQARLAFEESIAVIESIRAQLAGNEQQQEQFFENKLSPYQGMVQLLIAQNKNGEALAYAERAKARVLLDVLRSGRVNIAKAMTTQEQERERKLNNDLVSINNQISRESARSPSASSGPDLHEKLQRARVDYESFQTSLYVAHPELRVQRGEAQPATTEEIAALIPDAYGALLEYVVTGDKVYLFVATRRTATTQNTPDVKAYLLDIKRKDLVERAERFRKQLAARDLGFRDSARSLYDLLLTPAATQLAGKSSLIVVPDDVLWELPFQALQSAQNRFLLEDYAISYAPSLTVLREMIKLRRNRNQNRGKAVSLLAMANPALGSKTKERVKLTLRDDKLDSLPEAENEVKALAQLYGAAYSRVYVGAEAREERFKAEAPDATILHLATHGILNDAGPMYSQIVFSQPDSTSSEDGLLEAWEIMKLNLKADLVVLSACETARGRVGAGEGVIGLTWALFVAGSPTTLVSQWKVDSTSTTQLMLEFHRSLKNDLNDAKKEIGTARALRQAAMKLLHSNEYRHPFYWAGFVVVGDGS